jgi:hypothetical protein
LGFSNILNDAAALEGMASLFAFIYSFFCLFCNRKLLKYQYSAKTCHHSGCKAGFPGDIFVPVNDSAMIAPTTIHNAPGITTVTQVPGIESNHSQQMMEKSCNHRLANGWCSKSHRPCPLVTIKKQQQP